MSSPYKQQLQEAFVYRRWVHPREITYPFPVNSALQSRSAVLVVQSH